MMENNRTIVLVLRSGGDFAFRDVDLLKRHIIGNWKSLIKPKIILLWDRASEEYDLGNLHIIPLNNKFSGTWSRIQLYSPEMEKYRPFLYIDLDTAIIQSVEKIFDLIKDPTKFIVLEDFWQKKRLIATPLVWFPANSSKIRSVWDNRHTIVPEGRMDYYLRRVVTADLFWQDLTDGIIDFKPLKDNFIKELPNETILVCFHGKPRIFDAYNVPWINEYLVKTYQDRSQPSYPVTVIIPYNKDRGWLQDAVNSVPSNVQLILSRGDGNWPENFNKAFNQAEGKYIRWLHEDDMLTVNCIDDSIQAIESQNVDFIHGNAIEISRQQHRYEVFKPLMTHPTFSDLMMKNYLHQVTLMYRKSVFDKVGLLNEKLNVMEEYEFNLRCLKAGLKLGYCNNTLAYYRRHDYQKVRNVPKIEKERERELVRSMYRK